MKLETVDPIDQLMMMLAWDDDYTDEFKRKCIINALRYYESQMGQIIPTQLGPMG